MFCFQSVRILHTQGIGTFSLSSLSLLLSRAGLSGKNVNVVKLTDGFEVTGSGIILGSSALDGDSLYFEVTLFGSESQVGLKRHRQESPKSSLDLDSLEIGEDAWVFDRTISKFRDLVDGTVIGVHWDQMDKPMSKRYDKICHIMNAI